MPALDLLRALEGVGLHLSTHGGALKVQPSSALTDETRELIRSHKTELIELLMRTQEPPEAPMSPQSLKAMKMLELDPTLHRAVVTDSVTDPDVAVVAVAVRGVGVGEILVPKDRFDGLAVLAMLERYAGNPAIH